MIWTWDKVKQRLDRIVAEGKQGTIKLGGRPAAIYMRERGGEVFHVREIDGAAWVKPYRGYGVKVDPIKDDFIR